MKFKFKKELDYVVGHLRYDKEHTRVTIDGWRINDWDHSLRVAIEKYL